MVADSLSPNVAAFISGAVMFALSAVGYAYLRNRHAADMEGVRRERGLAEQQIEEEQARLRDYAEVSSDWFWETDSEKRFTRFSGHIFDALGIDGSSFIGKTRREISTTQPNDPHWQAHFAALDRHEAFQDFSYNLQLPDGNTMYISISGRPVFLDNGDFAGYRGTGRDLTAQRQMQSILSETQDRFRAVIDNAPWVVFLKDLDGKYLLANQLFLEWLGTDMETLAGRTISDRIDAETARQIEIQDREVIENDSVLEQELQMTFADGTVRHVLVIKFPVRDSSGNMTALGGINIDLTAQKNAEQARQKYEERMRSAVETLQEGFAIFDDADRLILANEEYLNAVPVARDILQRNGTFEELVRAVFEAGLIEAVDDDDDYERILENRLHQHRNPGEPVIVKYAGNRWFLLREAKTPEGGTVLTFNDITSLKFAEEAARQAKERAELASRTKTEFLANMSHELRTPLNSVIGMSEVLITETFGELNNDTYLEYAGDIHMSGRHLLAVITDILDIAKIEAGEILLVEAEVEVADILGECQRMIRDRLEASRVNLAARIEPDARKFWGDARRLKQIILNLLSNAVKFTPADGTITVSSSRGRNGTLIISVEDTGIGISREDFDRVLEPFRQVEGIMTRSHEGAGLGLSLVKVLTEAHGGTLELESEVGQGTKVTLIFPKIRIPTTDGDTSLIEFQRSRLNG